MKSCPTKCTQEAAYDEFLAAAADDEMQRQWHPDEDFCRHMREKNDNDKSFSMSVSYALSTTNASNDMNRKRILVTGANKGIGKAICARLLTEYQDTHVLLGSRSLERGQEAMQDLVEQCGTQAKSRLQLIQVDTSSDESVRKAAESIANEPLLYGIINNAGVRKKID